MARVTVEDCLEKVPNRFALVHLASQRTRELHKGSQPLVEGSKNKAAVTALREVADGVVALEEDLEQMIRDTKERR